MQPKHSSTVLAAALLALAAVPPAVAQEPDADAALRVVRLEAEPSIVQIEVGQELPFRVVAYDADGNEVDVPIRFAAPWRAVRVRRGTVRASQPGGYTIVASVMMPADADRRPVTLEVPVSVSWPAIERVDLTASPGRLYRGTTLRHRAAAVHADGTKRPEPAFRWSSSDTDVATVDRFGNVTANGTGTVTIAAELEGVRGTVTYAVAAFPAARMEITGGSDRARTGDVLTFDVDAVDADGRPIDDLPVTWSYDFVPDDSIDSPGSAGIARDGRFVGEVPGVYTVLATAGPLTARTTVDVRPREALHETRLVGHGRVSHVHTSDLWVFEGVDGRDYAITGTWGADGWAYMWDVTDPANMVKTDSVHVDARTVNDVKVSPDGRYAALSREGASNRRNGVVILDLADPAHPTIASTYDDGLTGGVHNMFATNDHLFALSAGDKYVILDMSDIRNPRHVSEYNHPDSRIHDVWVADGIAFSSEWGNGVVVVDVGNGRWGGSIENPKYVTNIPYPVGRTHAAFPYYQESTGRFYLFLGDEIIGRRGMAFGGLSGEDAAKLGGRTPEVTAGYIHVIDFTDPENPKDVARYHVDEYGTHNLWVEDDKLYVAYYEGGLRVVDVSGELMGNLYEQGREIAVFKGFDPNGYIANAPMAWGPQPYKGRVFFSDHNSGLWAVELEPPAEEDRTTT